MQRDKNLNEGGMGIPAFVYFFAFVLILFGLFATYAGYRDLSPIVPGLDQSNPAANMAAEMIGARSVAMAAVMLFGVLMRDRLVLLAGFSMAFLRESQDLLVTWMRPDTGLTTGVAIMFFTILASEAICIFLLARGGLDQRQRT